MISEKEDLGRRERRVESVAKILFLLNQNIIEDVESVYGLKFEFFWSILVAG